MLLGSNIQCVKDVCCYAVPKFQRFWVFLGSKASKICNASWFPKISLFEDVWCFVAPTVQVVRWVVAPLGSKVLVFQRLLMFLGPRISKMFDVSWPKMSFCFWGSVCFLAPKFYFVKDVWCLSAPKLQRSVMFLGVKVRCFKNVWCFSVPTLQRLCNASGFQSSMFRDA